MRSPPLSVLSLLAATAVACVQSPGRGPDLGACAELPDGVYGFGEAGIGSCLAGPTDLAFVERAGEPWLAVSNADPFLSFTGGSLLFIDWGSVTEGIARGDETLFVSDLETAVVPTEHFVGAMGLLPGRGEILLAQRLTEGGRTRAGDDDALVVDIEAAEALDAERVPLRDDPGDFVIDEDAGLAYALNFTDHSISVLDIAGDTIAPIDLAPEASLVALPFDDADASGSVAELDRLTVGEPGEVPDELWTLEWLPGSVRVQVPDGDTLSRWSSGGADYVPDLLGDNVDMPRPIADPAYALPSVGASIDATLANPEILYAAGGDLWSAVSGATIDSWSDGGLVLAGLDGTWMELLTGPSVTIVDDGAALFFAASTAADPSTRSVGFARADESGGYVPPAAPVLVPDAGQSYEQVFAQYDAALHAGRLWLSHWDGGRYVIGTSTFDDRSKEVLTFSPVATSLALDGQSIAAPVVRRFGGRYHLWASRDDATHWTHVHATSADGVRWGPLEDLFPSDAPYDPRQPPRVAVEHQDASYWRVRGRDRGLVETPAFNGRRIVDFTNGFSYTVANGHQFSADALFPLGRASQGIVPTSALRVDGARRLYVTITGDDGRDRLAIVDDATGPWDVLAQDLIPQGIGGNIAGASRPVVHRHGDAYILFYAARGAAGVPRVRMATSDDGIAFQPVGDDLFPEIAPWASGTQEPHSVEVDTDGTVRLWFSANDGARWRIGAVLVAGLDDPATATFTLDPLPFSDFQLASGLPGGADDSGVKDPVVVREGDQRVLYYAGFDGTRWSICRADDHPDGWRRREDRDLSFTLPALAARSGTFTTGGVDSPVALRDANGDLAFYFAGYDTPEGDNTIPRIGRAVPVGPALIGDYEQPTVGDTLAFESIQGSERADVIELQQVADTFALTGTGTTSIVHDADAGMLYVPSKLSNLLYVVDIREDVRVGRPDANARDLETVVRFTTVGNNAGFRGATIDPVRRRMYLTTRNPDAVAVMDLAAVEDDDDKEVTDDAFLATLPLQDDRQDRGGDSVAAIGGAQPLLVGDLLVVPNFSDNSVSVLDMGLGPYGAEIAHVADVGENPHIAAVSPDGRWVVVANYLGDLDGNLSSATLALLDLDPSSPTYLTVPHWIKNR
jgi:DNA-binding beta-propeller fold protein YncE